MDRSEGFTLTELLVTMLITSVIALSMGAFFVRSMDNTTLAQERIGATFMAEQIMEEWQYANTPPTPDCTINGVGASALQVGQTIINCQAINGSKKRFVNILINENIVKAPIPPNHINNPNPNGINGRTADVIMGDLVDPNDGSAIKTRFTKVSWNHKGKVHFVLLTHIRSAF